MAELTEAMMADADNQVKLCAVIGEMLEATVSIPRVDCPLPRTLFHLTTAHALTFAVPALGSVDFLLPPHHPQYPRGGSG
jgi:hypothetical protein